MAAADEHGAALIVLGPHRRSGLLGHFQGSVTAAVVTHARVPVLLIPDSDERAVTVEYPSAESITAG